MSGGESPVKYTPPLFKRLSEQQRAELDRSMRAVIDLHHPGDSRPHESNWAVYWAKEFLRALDETKATSTLPLEPMICGCAQGSHEERRNTVEYQKGAPVQLCKLGWPQ